MGDGTSEGALWRFAVSRAKTWHVKAVDHVQKHEDQPQSKLQGLDWNQPLQKGNKDWCRHQCPYNRWLSNWSFWATVKKFFQSVQEKSRNFPLTCCTWEVEQTSSCLAEALTSHQKPTGNRLMVTQMSDCQSDLQLTCFYRLGGFFVCLLLSPLPYLSQSLSNVALWHFSIPLQFFFICLTH